MSSSPLDPQELAAIQAAMRDSRSGPVRPRTIGSEEVTSLALIADDRAAETSRPIALQLGERWAKAARHRLRHFLPGTTDVDVVNVDVVDGATLREELRTMWACDVLPAHRSGVARVAVGGAVIEAAAARMCGSELETGDAERPPSAMALCLFAPVGRAIAEALVQAWHQEQRCVVAIGPTTGIEPAPAGLLEADVLIALTLELSGSARGRILLIARPITLVAPPAPIAAVPAAPGAIDAALALVPIEVRVELGRVRLTMREIAALSVGTVIPMLQFIDDPVPLSCGGVVKAHGKPVVCRGALAVEILTVANAKGDTP
jgi:flagellar motor switch protein FliM